MWWATGQGVEFVVRRTAGGLQQACTASLELPIERQAVQVRAADHQAGHVVACRCRGGWLAGQGLQGIGQAQQVLVGKGAAEQRHPPRQAVSHEAARHGHGGIVQQVHEVGVVTQFGIAQHRFGFQFGQGHRPADGWSQYAVQAVQQCVALGLERLQAIVCAERLHAIDIRRLGQYCAYNWQHRLRVLLHQLASHAVALGHPRPFVEQPRGFEEGREVERDGFTPQCLQPFDGLGEQHRALGATEVLQVFAARHAEAERPWLAEGRGVVPQRVGAAVFVAGVEPGGQGEQLAGFTGAGAEEADAVQCAAGRHHPGRGDQALAGLEPDQVVQRRRHTAGAGRVGAQGKAGHAKGDGQ
ncbi:hypothetical protein D9M71_185980 [compost metagenome]